MAALAVALGACGGDVVGPEALAVTGTVRDDAGGRYPGVVVRVGLGGAVVEVETDGAGAYRYEPPTAGVYAVDVAPPLATRVEGPTPVRVEVGGGAAAVADVRLRAQSVPAHVNVGAVDFLGEVRTASGGAPADPAGALYARNVFDAPFGQLTPIETPDGRPVTLADWTAASGRGLLRCDGRSSTVDVALAGLVPGGTYSLWLNVLTRPAAVGERISFGGDVSAIESLGTAARNVVRASGAGAVDVEVGHAGCLLTRAPGLVLAVVYHTDGNTFGEAHIPDPEEVTQLLLYVHLGDGAGP